MTILERAGCVAAPEEAAELLAAARHGSDLAGMVRRRVAGEPLAWITGNVSFCGLTVAVDPGVYVPRWQSEPLARLAARWLPTSGVAVDVATGSGALALVLQAARPRALVVASDLDPLAVACAARNGVTVYHGDLDAPLPEELAGRVDVMVAVLPYVPTDELRLLPSDVQRFEPHLALDGGREGLRLLGELARRSVRWLKPGGRLLLELGGDQGPILSALLDRQGFVAVEMHHDADGDVRSIGAVWPGLTARSHGPSSRNRGPGPPGYRTPGVGSTGVDGPIPLGSDPG